MADRRGAVCRFFYARKFPCVLSIRIVGSLSWSPVFSGGGFCTAPVSCVVRGSRADCGFRAIARLQARNARASYGISVVASGSGGYSCLLRAVVWPIWRLMDEKQPGSSDPGCFAIRLVCRKFFFCPLFCLCGLCRHSLVQFDDEIREDVHVVDESVVGRIVGVEIGVYVTVREPL